MKLNATRLNQEDTIHVLSLLNKTFMSTDACPTIVYVVEVNAFAVTVKEVVVAGKAIEDESDLCTYSCREFERLYPHAIKWSISRSDDDSLINNLDGSGVRVDCAD